MHRELKDSVEYFQNFKLCLAELKYSVTSIRSILEKLLNLWFFPCSITSSHLLVCFDFAHFSFKLFLCSHASSLIHAIRFLHRHKVQLLAFIQLIFRVIVPFLHPLFISILWSIRLHVVVALESTSRSVWGLPRHSLVYFWGPGTDHRFEELGYGLEKTMT